MDHVRAMDWTLMTRLDWEGGRRVNGLLKNQWRWCFTLEGEAFHEVRIVDRQGREFHMLCDPEDLPLVRAHTWSANMNRNTYYGKSCLRKADGAWAWIQIHTLLCPEWSKVDHINRNGLDNRRVNLRDGSGVVNARNCRMSKNNTSEVTGSATVRPRGAG